MLLGRVDLSARLLVFVHSVCRIGILKANNKANQPTNKILLRIYSSLDILFSFA